MFPSPSSLELQPGAPNPTGGFGRTRPGWSIFPDIHWVSRVGLPRRDFVPGPGTVPNLTGTKFSWSTRRLGQSGYEVSGPLHLSPN